MTLLKSSVHFFSRVLSPRAAISLMTRAGGLFVFVFFMTACAIPLKSPQSDTGYRQVGLASWYGKDFHGKPTASGEIYDMFEISAAHKSLPMGTLLLVTDLDTGKTVKVKINDRGPFVGERILDLSYGAAKHLGIVRAGIAQVEFSIIGRAPIFLPGTRVEKQFFVQIGSYEVEKHAVFMKKKVARHYRDVFLKTSKTAQGQRYRVHLGPYETEEEARSAIESLRLNPLLDSGMSPIVVLNQ